MKCRVCGRGGDVVTLGYMNMKWVGLSRVDGVLCEDCITNVVAHVNEFFTLKSQIDKILKDRVRTL